MTVTIFITIESETKGQIKRKNACQIESQFVGVGGHSKQRSLKTKKCGIRNRPASVKYPAKIEANVSRLGYTKHRCLFPATSFRVATRNSRSVTNHGPQVYTALANISPKNPRTARSLPRAELLRRTLGLA